MASPSKQQSAALPKAQKATAPEHGMPGPAQMLGQGFSLAWQMLGSGMGGWGRFKQWHILLRRQPRLARGRQILPSSVGLW